MENEPRYDVRPEEYAAVIRDLIKHEDDVTNHRLMWLLVLQGLFANAYVTTSKHQPRIALIGILVTFSSFTMLYKSYQARGYLHFLGAEAKLGRLEEKYLELDGWPRNRIKHWREAIWLCPWLERASDLIEPYLYLPGLFVWVWLYVLLQPWIPLG